jgi:4-aminobutyrate aminotransferase
MDWPKVASPFPGPRAREVIALDRERMSPSLTRLYPFVADHGDGCWIWDVDGNCFLDFAAGIAVAVTGYNHPHVTAAIHHQAGKLLHYSLADFYNEPAALLAARLGKLFPGGQDTRVFLCNSGAESIECALKLARYSTGRPRLIAFHGAFHGRTTGALALGDSKPIHKEGFGPLLPGVIHVDYSMQGLEELETLFSHKVRPEWVAAVFAEPIQGERGVIIPDERFFPQLLNLCHRHGILLVLDEVQTGMGRTGKMFACEHWEIVPDIICVSKGIASGMPLGAVIAKSSVMAWPPGTHASTFGGNPVSCASALATLDVLEGGLIDHARDMGEVLNRRMHEMARHYPIIQAVRGKGLMVGAELACHGRPATPERDALLHAALHRGLVLLAGGQSVVRMCPPLIVSRREIEIAFDIFESALNVVIEERRVA